MENGTFCSHSTSPANVPSRTRAVSSTAAPVSFVTHSSLPLNDASTGANARLTA